MRTFTLTLYAKRSSDGNYECSLNVWENRNAGNLAAETNFESEASLRQQIEAVLPIGQDANTIPTEAQRAADYWFPFTMPMSDAQAANLGWLAGSPLERNLVH